MAEQVRVQPASELEMRTGVEIIDTVKGTERIADAISVLDSAEDEESDSKKEDSQSKGNALLRRGRMDTEDLEIQLFNVEVRQK